MSTNEFDQSISPNQYLGGKPSSCGGGLSNQYQYQSNQTKTPRTKKLKHDNSRSNSSNSLNLNDASESAISGVNLDDEPIDMTYTKIYGPIVCKKTGALSEISELVYDYNYNSSGAFNSSSNTSSSNTFKGSFTNTSGNNSDDLQKDSENEPYNNVYNYTDNTESEEYTSSESDFDESTINTSSKSNSSSSSIIYNNIKDSKIEEIIRELNSYNSSRYLSARNLKISLKKNIIHPDGYLKVIMGCMFSGKTTFIIFSEANKWRSIGKRVIIINYAEDVRYSKEDKVFTHDEYSVDCVMVHNFTPELTEQIKDYDVVLINEGQFFTNLVNTVNEWCDKMKKIVIVAGLDGDFRRGEFGEMLQLIPNCDKVKKLKAYCEMCRDGTRAIFTWKICNNTNTDDVKEVGVDQYIPLCRRHYNEERACSELLNVNKE